MTNSYKIYWLRAFVEEVLAGAETISFARMSARMVALAWYPINYFHLSLGLQDQLGRAVATCKEELGLGDAESSDVIISTVENTTNPVVRKHVDALCKYVPYRAIRIFYENELNAARKANGQLPDRLIHSTVLESNRANANGAPYVFNDTCDGIRVEPDWADYITTNSQVIQGWLDMRLVEYLQARNPSVPAIPLKIRAPKMRDLGAATAYWNEALALAPFAEIYSGHPFNPESFESYGSLSIDHFIPWSFVLHDEPWNLVPMFRNSNSSKSDKLPDLAQYLEPFARQQFDAFLAVRNTGRHKHVLEAYLQLEPALGEFSDTPECRAVFAHDIESVIRPLHQIALNQGFALWEPRFEYALVNL